MTKGMRLRWGWDLNIDALNTNQIHDLNTWMKEAVKVRDQLESMGYKAQYDESLGSNIKKFFKNMRVDNALAEIENRNTNRQDQVRDFVGYVNAYRKNF